MRKIILSILFLLLMVNAASAFSGGAGTSDNPWQISTLTDLQAIGTNSTTKAAHYIQINDIDASTTSTWNSGAGFLPISKFTGHYDGQDYTITGLYINRSLTNYIGLFGIIGSGGVVENLGVINAQITGQGDVGVLAGRATLATVNRCYTSGTSSGAGSVGGFIGVSEDNSISNSFSRANVANSGYISGGFCASVAGGGMANCYSTGTVTGVDYKGGLIGYAMSSPSVTSCYWDTQTSGMSTSALGTGKTTAQMKTQSTFTGWDFNNVWRMEGYPVLSPNRDFYLYPGNITINRDAPPLLHSITLDMFRWGTYSYEIIVSSDPTYTEIVYNVNSLATYSMSNLTRTISLNAGEYWLTVNAKDSTGTTLETLTREFEIAQTFNLGETSAAGAVYETISGIQTPVSEAALTIYNDTYSANYRTGSTGYYQFLGLSAGSTYYIKASKNGYTDSTLNIVTPSAGETVTRNIIMMKESAPTYIMPHYVRFVPKWLWAVTYPDLLVTVYEGNSATALVSDITGSDGAVGFELSETVKYRITVVNSERGISDTFYITPTKNEYILPIGMGDDYEQIETIDGLTFAITKSNINLSSGYINCTYSDPSGTFTGANFIIADYNGTALYTLTSTNANHTFSQIVPSGNSTYLCNLTIANSELSDPFKTSAIVHFTNGIREHFDFGWEHAWNYHVLSIIIIILLGTIAGAVHAPIISLVQGAFFLLTLYAGWLPARLDVIFMGIFGIVLAFAMAMRKGEEGMR